MSKESRYFEYFKINPFLIKPLAALLDCGMHFNYLEIASKKSSK